ncbi:hypothetical protein [Streptomyces sp. NPDC058155]|uniref:hypothetical protein n=1 Tax=Streptomyces sp. NPDC058155 TaxID=3346359 RepID=UPI0036E19B59
MPPVDSAAGAGAIRADVGPEEDDPRVRDALAIARAVGELRQESLFNFGEMTGVKLTAVLGQMLEHSELPDAYLDTVRAVFAEPKGFRDAYTAFEEPGSVLVLLREPGAGRAFTAQALLAELRHRTGAQVGPLSFGGGNRFPVRRLPPDNNVGYLLELPADEEKFEVAADFGATLGRIQYTLGKRNSRLIVLTTPQQWGRIRAGAPADAVPELGLPSPADVASAWLRAEEPSFPTHTWLNDRRIEKLLAGQSPADVLHIVSLILKTTRSPNSPSTAGTGEDAFNSQVDSVEAARTNWREELLAWHRRGSRTSFQRNFLLVAALLRNAPVAHIYAKTAELCQHLEDNEVSLKGQGAPGVIEMVASIEAKLESDDTVQFAKPGWDDAVLSYFWVDRPMAREPFLAWMAKAPVAKSGAFLETLTMEDRLLLANRVGAFGVRWAVRHGKPRPLEEIVLAWRKDETLWRAAVDLISAAALHPTMERFIHEVLLRWSKNGTEERAALQKMTVDVCAGEFGRHHTGKALRRLRHAAASPYGDVQESLHAAVRNLWSDSSARMTLFNSVVAWCSDDPDRGEAGRRSFGALATLRAEDSTAMPVLLMEKADDADFEPAVEDLTVGWRSLLATDDEANEAGQTLNIWMDVAWRYPSRRPVVFSVLRGAVSTPGGPGAGRPRHRLRDLLYRWQPVPSADADPERVQLRHELADLLDHDRNHAVALYRPHRPGRGETSR